MKRIGKIISDIITLICITAIIWLCASVIEIGEHNTERNYQYSEYNLLIMMFPEK